MKTRISRNITNDQSSAEFWLVVYISFYYYAIGSQSQSTAQMHLNSFQKSTNLLLSYPSKILTDTAILIRTYAN